MKLGEWSAVDRQMAEVWRKWTKANAPVRRHDMRVLEEAVFALAHLREIKAVEQEGEELGKTPVKIPGIDEP